MITEESKNSKQAKDLLREIQKKQVAEFADDAYIKNNGSLKLGKDVSQNPR
jgi:hypothetical protein